MATVSPKTARKITSMAADGLDVDEIAVDLGADAVTVNQVLGEPSCPESAPASAGIPHRVHSAGASDPHAPATFSGSCGVGGAERASSPDASASARPAGSGDPAGAASPTPEGPERQAPAIAERLGHAPAAASSAGPSVGRCEGCKVWDRGDLTHGFLGRCKRYAPAIVHNPKSGKLASMWPITHADEWCADHVAGGGA